MHSILACSGLISTLLMAMNADDLYVARPLTPEGSFTAGIEGPACDKQGDIFAVNFQREGTIGRVTPEGKAEVFVELPAGSVGNGIRFDRQGMMYLADYTKHNVLRIDPKTRAVTVFAHEDRMSQPNDLAIGPDETLYASDPDWKQGTGQLWRIDRSGKVTRLAEGMGTANGIEVSPDGKTLYVNETVRRKVWAFAIAADHTLAGKRLLIEFPDFGMDGMRCDVDGNLYVTRHGKGTVAKVSSQGKMLREIDVLGKMPSNICFGGRDGCTAYVTEVEHRRLVWFRVERPTENTSEYRERLAAEKKYPEALQAYRDALAIDAKNPMLMYNAGLMAYLCKKPKEAAEFWSKEKAIEPDDWQVRAKLVQAHEAAGNVKERDAEREGLFKLRKNAADKELKNLECYCRDQFSVGKDQVIVFEHFELEGDHAVRLRFLVLEPDGQNVQSRYSLGSYRRTNQIARELKEIKPDQRLFHLDGYFNGGRSHRTYEFYTNEPKYDVVKAAVKEILEGKRKPTSGIDF